MPKTRAPRARTYRRLFPLYPVEIDPDLSRPNPHRNWTFPSIQSHGSAAGPYRVERGDGVEPWTHLEFQVRYEKGEPSIFSGRRKIRGNYLDLSATRRRGNITVIQIGRTPCDYRLIEEVARFDGARLERTWRACLAGYLSQFGPAWDLAGPFQGHYHLYPVDAETLYEPIRPEWRGQTVRGLLSAMMRAAGLDCHGTSGFEALPILADALEEAGCGDERLLGQMRTDPSADPIAHEILVRCLQTPYEDDEP